MMFQIALGLFWGASVLAFFVRALNIRAIPTSRCSHSAPVPTAGGVSIFVIFLVFLWVDKPWPKELIVVYTISSSLLALVSFIDDCHPLSYRIRIIVHILSGSIIALSGLHLNIFDSHVSVILTIVFFVSLINGFNFIDGLDGLLPGCTLVALICFMAIDPGLWVKALFFSILGFFIFNFPKASLFLGDVGSTFLGLTFGACALLAQRLGGPKIAYTIHAIFPMAFVGFDVVSTMILRLIKGHSLTVPHREQMIHLLNDVGYSHQFITLCYMAGTALCGGLSILVFYGYFNFVFALVLYIILQILWVIFVRRKSINRVNGSL